MEISIQSPEGDACFVHVKPNAVSIMVGERAVYTFDRAGRLLTAVIEDRTYRRGLDNRFLVKWREPQDGTPVLNRRWLQPVECRKVVERVQADVGSVLAALAGRSGDPDSNLFASRLENIARFDWDALSGDSARLSRVYKPIGILPPDQYLALVLQATEGCSFNRCTFCGFYRDRPFRVKTPAEFKEHIGSVLGFLGEGATVRKSVFLADANAVCVPREQLLPLLDMVNSLLPMRSIHPDGWLDGIGSFVDAFPARDWSSGDFAEMRDRNVRRLYLGVETGCNELLRFLRKPQTAEDVFKTVSAIKGSGIAVGVILMLGIGGDKFATRHVGESLALLNSFPWGRGDLIFLSSLLEFAGTEYPAIAEKKGIRPLSAREMRDQYLSFRSGIRRLAGNPRIAPYNAEEFLY